MSRCIRAEFYVLELGLEQQYCKAQRKEQIVLLLLMKFEGVKEFIRKEIKILRNDIAFEFSFRKYIF